MLERRAQPDRESGNRRGAKDHGRQAAACRARSFEQTANFMIDALFPQRRGEPVRLSTRPMARCWPAAFDRTDEPTGCSFRRSIINGRRAAARHPVAPEIIAAPLPERVPRPPTCFTWSPARRQAAGLTF